MGDTERTSRMYVEAEIQRREKHIEERLMRDRPNLGVSYVPGPGVSFSGGEVGPPYS